MARRRTTKKRGRGRPARGRPSLRLPSLPELPELEQRHFDVIGLGLVGLGSFFAFVFYLGWEGGKVGGALADALVFLFGAVGYLVPVVLFATGTVLVLKPMLPSLTPFRTGGALLLGALMLGFAGGLFGLGPDDPARDGWMQPSFVEDHGGVVGEAAYWVIGTLFQDVGAYIAFLFLLLAGVLLLTGASIAGLIRGTGAGLVQTSQRVRRSTGEFAAVVTRRQRDAGAPAAREPEPDRPPRASPPEPRGEPVVRATHVEAPALDPADEDEAAAPEAPPEPAADEHAPPRAARPDPAAVAAGDPEDAGEELTPQGNRRSAVTEADDLDYVLPRPGLLERSKGGTKVDSVAQERIAGELVETLGHFGIEARVVGSVAGPHVTRYELRLQPGVKMSKVAQLKDDLAYALAATEIRILAPIPGKQAVGVEVPNEDRKLVHLGDVLQDAPAGWSPLTVWLGKDIAGKAIGTDLAKQPHVLVAGTTGSGKSGCINAMLSSILLRATPNDVRLVLVDPKQVELNHYEHIPHLLTPVVTSPRLAANVLANLIKEMEQRYAVMSRARARNLVELNRLREREGERPLPYVLCVIDELADLMMIAPGEVEDAVIRLAQKSRAVGIHLLLATQRPSADVITGMIKANVPARIAFAVASQTDSRVILDQNGAESLLGQGDMLFRPASESRAARIQGAFIGEPEIERITEHWRRQGEPEMHEELLEAVEPAEDEQAGDFHPDQDDLLPEAIATVVQLGSASTSMLQRRLRVGYTRAGRLIDMMERRGVISGYEGSKARQVLISEADLPRVLAALDEPVGAVAGDPA
ncbi:MAG TPA: DNA translocase FtsK 4TM domain-containing protein [Thermoleophilaceae bacterium]|jgi:S-DNA-T family DNA segregation ATPase FtsK/SpoIIIE